MKSEVEIKTEIRNWIIRKGKIQDKELDNQTPFLEKRIISSVQLMELILFLEDLSGNPIDVKSLKKGMLRDVDTIFKNFF